MLRTGCLRTLVVVVIVCLLGLAGVTSAQGGRDPAFARVRAVQERHTRKMMAKAGIVGTAVGLDKSGRYAVVILLEGPGARDIPADLEGIPVRQIVTGKIYALGRVRPRARQTPAAHDTTVPAAPTGLVAEAVSNSRIDLKWNANSEADLDHYNVYRSVRPIGPYSKIGMVPAGGSPAYSDTGLPAGTTFYYVVTAVDASINQSHRSNEASAKTLTGVEETSIGPRPAPLGVSTGHPRITAGTIACRVYKDVGGVLLYYALSNNHVYADENRASIGDNVLQPGAYDGGQDPRDKIGALADFQDILFSKDATNQIDAAIAQCTPATLGNSTPDGSFTPSRTTAAATVGLTVKKYGRTTGLTRGKVDAVNATVDVTYDSGTARFVGQMVISPGTFSAGGDSGSLIVTEDGNYPVGLLFAGGDTYTVANPIDLVLSRFGVTVDGQ
jgi:hypothetical protein